MNGNTQNTSPEELTKLVEQFNEKHDTVQSWSQFLVLIEEIGELSECLLKSEGYKISKDNTVHQSEIAEEIADVIYLGISLASLYNIDWYDETVKTAKENLEK